MSERIEWLDAWRGLAVWLMIFYHLCYDLMMFGWLSRSVVFSLPMTVLERFIAFSFILCAGASCRFSRNNFRRGLVCAGAGLLVVAASFVVDAPILFGVLQLLSAAMLIYALVGRWTDRLPRALAPFLWLGLYFAFKWWTDNTLVDVRWLYWLGFRYEGFVSYDYFPILPFVFLFLLGTCLGGWLKTQRDDPAQHRPMPRWLVWPGRRSMLIYLAHQPLLYGGCWLAAQLLS